jgi:F420-non-reducing hydrogenase large subunit
MATLTFPISRMEGHAHAVVEVQRGEIKSAHFHATELRGFEYLVQGAPAEQMPVIVPRICGVCSTAHHVAAVKALEDAFDVEPPPLAGKIRELLMLGQLIQNQATSMFLFTMPDRFGVSSLFHLPLEIESEEVLDDFAARALQVRQAGTHLLSVAGGQFIHPIKAVIGGVTSGIKPDMARGMREELESVLPIARALFDYYWETSLEMGERIGSWGDDQPACYIASVIGPRPDFCGDVIRVLGCDDEGANAEVCTIFPANEFRDHLDYEETDYSYAPISSFRGQVMRANSLARANIIDEMGTPYADGYLERFHREFGRPAHAIMLFELARGIELVYALERAVELLAEPLHEGDPGVPYEPRDGVGYGLVEAPRGPLIHRYIIEEGLIARAEFVIPTTHNMLAIERALRVAAERYIDGERVDLELERAVGRVARAFDPCIACATH